MAIDQIGYPDLVSMVRSALTHLYDYAHLQNHPLATLVDGTYSLDEITRAQKLRRLLLDCIEEIRPQEAGEPASEADRVYAILTYRYVDGLPMDKVAEKRGLGERQAYRALEKGVKAVAGLLQDRIRRAAQPPTHLAPPDRTQLAEVEAARLHSTGKAEPLDLRDLAESILALLAPLATQAGIRLRLEGTSRPWPPVAAHRVVLRQALLSLLSHALDTLPPGDLTLCAHGNSTRVILEVAHQTPLPNAHPEPDLSVAHSLLVAQGAHLETGLREGRWQARILFSPAGKATLLIIDDNVDLVALLQRYLAGHHIEVIGATSGEEALRLARERQPRLITLDVMLPDQDGWEILQRLKTEPATRDIPVIICSVLNERKLAEAMGASDYITKPVSQDSLLAALTRWLGPLQPLA